LATLASDFAWSGNFLELLLVESIPMIVDSPVSMMDDKILLDGQYETEQELSKSGEKYSVQIRRQDVAKLLMGSRTQRKRAAPPSPLLFTFFSPTGELDQIAEWARPV
jgi:hypothetical protein